MAKAKSKSGPTPKIMEAFDPSLSLVDVARHVLDERLSAVVRAVARVARRGPESPKLVRAIHVLRVTTRRADAAIGAFAGVLRKRRVERVSASVAAIRKAAGRARDLDVLQESLKELAEGEKSVSKATLRFLLAYVKGERARAIVGLEAALVPERRHKLQRAIEKLPEGTARGTSSAASIHELAKSSVRKSVARVRKAAGRDVRELPLLHDVRLGVKELRYTLEIFGGCFSSDLRAEHYPTLVELQAHLGAVNDADALLIRLRSALATIKAPAAAKMAKASARGTDLAKTPRASVEAKIRDELIALIASHEQRLKAAHADVLKRWFPGNLERLLRAIEGDAGLALRPYAKAPERLTASSMIEAKPEMLNGAHGGKGGVGSRGKPARRRVAAIDIGSNSLRLIIAETSDDASYRVLDDEKEVTRLGRGLQKTGMMDPSAIEHTVMTVDRMLSIAKGYGASHVRVVATAAAREAGNADDLVRAIKNKTGVDLEIISGDEEAMLAYRSAARAFDLSSQSALVLDIGGGSTDMVLSAAGSGHSLQGGGVIEHVYSLSLGAVRLTEKFGGPERSGGERFEKMRRYVRGVLEEQVGRAPILPQVVVGTGGTLTTLGAMAMLRGTRGEGQELFSKVQGVEVGRSDIKHFIDFLRKLPVEERTRVAGLSADRADIIVSGLVILDAVVKHFGANRLRVHEGGIRDGILLGLVRSPASDGKAGAETESQDPMRGVRRFAKACAYEAAHSKHVTRLALRIFDQLAQRSGEIKMKPGMSFASEARVLLEASALLHDVGYLINYAQHHKHSYHLILHADLPGLTTRQVQVVANVARYHRAAEPKGKHRTFASLADADQQLVRQLAGILRVADGFDRTHMQSIRDVRVDLSAGTMRMAVVASEQPSVDMWGAMRKSGLLEKVIGRSTNVEWINEHGIASVEGPGRSGGAARKAGVFAGSEK